MFEEVSKNLIVISQEFLKLLNTTDREERQKIHKEIKRLENVGDNVKRQIILELGRNFITPFDREDIHALAISMDNVVNYVYETSTSIQVYGVEKPSKDIIAIAEILQKQCLDLDKAISELKTWKNIRNITDSCVRIGTLESQADQIYDRALAELFQVEKDAIEIIKQKEVLVSIETATDMAEDVASVIESILVKHA